MKVGLDFLSKLVKKGSFAQSELLINSSRSISFRLAQNQILQPTVEENAQVGVKVVLGKKVGFFSTNSLARKQIKEAFQKALRLARLAPAKEDFISLPQPSPPSSHPPTPDKQLEKVRAREAIGLVQPLLKKLKRKASKYQVR